MYLYNFYTDTLLYWTLLFHVLVSLWHRHTQVYDMTISCITDIGIAFLLHGFTCIHALIVHVFMLHELLLLVYSCSTVTGIFPEYSAWSFPVFLIFIWHSCYLDISTFHLRCVKLSATWDKPYHIHGRGHLWNLWGPPLESHVLWILYFLSPVILLHIITIISV